MIRRILFLSLLTLICLPALGFLIIYLVEGDLVWHEIINERNFVVQLFFGSLHAIISLFFIMLVLNARFFETQKLKYINFVKNLKLNIPAILLISFCAGFGEELLFRFAIQRYFGIWPTAIIFIAIHGYLKPKKHTINIYGILMIFVAAGFGYLYEYVGIWSAILSHTLIDIILLTYGMKNIKH